MLRAGVNLVASEVVRYAFNRYHVQLMTSLIIQRKRANPEVLRYNFTICPSTGVYESRILSSVYIYIMNSWYDRLIVTPGVCSDAQLIVWHHSSL